MDVSCVIFAKTVEHLVQFYQPVLGADIVEAAKSHTVLAHATGDLVIHAIPAAVAKKITLADPPEPRSSAAIKPVFTIDSLQRVYSVAQAAGGAMKSLDSAWDIRGFLVVDGWDPEGNVVQFKQRKQ